MMKKPGKEGQNKITALEFVEPERAPLSSNKSNDHSPCLDFLDTSAEEVSEDMILKYLASIISTIYLKKQCPHNKNIEQ